MEIIIRRNTVGSCQIFIILYSLGGNMVRGHPKISTFS